MTCGPASPGTPRLPWSPSWPSLRPRPGDVVGYATRIALRELGRRAEFPGGQLERLDELIVPLVTAHAPGLLALYGIGPNTAALLLIAAGDHPERLRSEANLDEEHITAHVGRHPCATTLISGGTDLVALADMLGHARLDTVRLYTHSSAADRERALNLLSYDANQARWRYYTYLVATPCTAAGRGAP